MVACGAGHSGRVGRRSVSAAGPYQARDRPRCSLPLYSANKGHSAREAARRGAYTSIDQSASGEWKSSTRRVCQLSARLKSDSTASAMRSPEAACILSSRPTTWLRFKALSNGGGRTARAAESIVPNRCERRLYWPIHRPAGWRATDGFPRQFHRIL